jgi:flagellar protein FlgJ
MSAQEAGPSVANDVNGLKPGAMAMRPKIDPKAMDQKLHEVAALYEEQFMREMVKAMRGTVQESGLIKVSQGEQIYREQLDQNYVNSWSKQGGVGLQDMIYKQLTEKYGPMMGLKKPLQKPEGPVPLDAKSQFAPTFRQTPAGKLSIQLSRELLSNSSPEKITSPWSAKLLGVQEINPNEYVVNLDHDNGRKSQFVFRGVLDSQLQGSQLQTEPKQLAEGQALGYLSPDAQNFFWNLK